MRRRLFWTAIAVLIAGSMFSCATKATDDEIASMCANLVQLRGEVGNPAVETIVSDITVRFDSETKKIEESRQKELQALKDELQAKLDAAAKDDEKAKIQAEYDALLAEAQARHEPALKAMNDKKKEAVEEAKKQVEENRAAWNDAVDQCATQAKEEGVSQDLARCRIQAESTDKYWNGCR